MEAPLIKTTRIPNALPQLEKKPSRHHRQQRGSGHGGGGGRGGGGGGGAKRPLRATLLRGERGISIEFGKFVALISISGWLPFFAQFYRVTRQLESYSGKPPRLVGRYCS